MRKAFTLAEVLITLGIIGVVAAITMPVLINKYNDKQFKVAYKKTYSDLQQALTDAIFNQELTTRTTKYDGQATTEEWNMIKSKFKVAKVCENSNAFDCWADADRVCTGACGGGGSGSEFSGVPGRSSKAFVDASGRSWCRFTELENLFLVDTNGMKAPNRFGKDRWIFTFKNKNGERTNNAVDYVKIGNFLDDILNEGNWCHYPPCYYKSWLYE